MFLLAYLSEPINYTIPSNYSLNLTPGYYKVTMRGAQGGKSCIIIKNQVFNLQEGGLGANLTGIMHLTGNFTYTITVGSNPDTNCSLKNNLGGKFGLGGTSGYDSWQDIIPGGGGGYSSIHLKDHDLIIAMVGGGSGASSVASSKNIANPSYLDAKGHAGGIGYSYGCYNVYNPERQNKCDNCWSSKYHQGGDGKDTSGGGGGGYFGGQGGDNYDCAFGGSSNYSENHWIEPKIFDGTQHSETGNGSVLIEPIALCAEGCNDCEMNSKDKCTSCLNGYYMSGSECVACPPTCSSCTDGKSCTTCRSGYILYNGQCALRCKHEACDFLYNRRFILKRR